MILRSRLFYGIFEAKEKVKKWEKGGETLYKHH